MSRRATIWLAWSLWAVTLALVVGSLLLGVANRPEAPLYEYWLESALINPTFATLGALIVSHRPENVIGWIFCVSSIAGAFSCSRASTRPWRSFRVTRNRPAARLLHGCLPLCRPPLWPLPSS